MREVRDRIDIVAAYEKERKGKKKKLFSLLRLMSLSPHMCK